MALVMNDRHRYIRCILCRCVRQRLDDEPSARDHWLVVMRSTNSRYRCECVRLGTGWLRHEQRYMDMTLLRPLSYYEMVVMNIADSIGAIEPSDIGAVG